MSLVVGLNSFRNNFKFSQANNVSRITFFKGLIISILVVALFMSLIDIIINRLYNVFVSCPMNFDMIYGILQWMFSAYSTIIIMGILISLVYYKSSKLVKVIISVMPFVLIIAALNILSAFFWQKTGKFISVAFDWDSGNTFMGVLSFAVLSVVFMFFYVSVGKKSKC